jgi:predicted RNA-binding protein with PUA-like domain
MNYWLMKSEPSTYSWEDMLRDKVTYWDGVRNYQARNNMKAMSVDDLVLFYHSVKQRDVVGVMKVVKEAYRDPTSEPEDDRWVVVDVAPVATLKVPVNLTTMKQEESLSGMSLIRQSRLSVCPLTQAEFKRILELGDTPYPQDK